MPHRSGVAPAAANKSDRDAASKTCIYDLPYELREQIFSDALHGAAPIKLPSRKLMYSYEGSYYPPHEQAWDERAQDRLARNVDSLALASKQLRAEVLEIYWSRNTFALHRLWFLQGGFEHWLTRGPFRTVTELGVTTYKCEMLQPEIATVRSLLLPVMMVRTIVRPPFMGRVAMRYLKVQRQFNSDKLDWSMNESPYPVYPAIGATKDEHDESFGNRDRCDCAIGHLIASAESPIAPRPYDNPLLGFALEFARLVVVGHEEGPRGGWAKAERCKSCGNILMEKHRSDASEADLAYERKHKTGMLGERTPSSVACWSPEDEARRLKKRKRAYSRTSPVMRSAVKTASTSINE